MNKLLLMLLGSYVCMCVYSQQIEYKVNLQTGAIERLSIHGDERNMNWLVATDGSQYAWIKEQYGWGLGYFTEDKGGETIKRVWKTPVVIKKSGSEVIYLAGDIEIKVKRSIKDSDLIEEYIFCNKGKQSVSLLNMGIYTPFNDNYPSADVCMNSRAHAHIWAGENGTYINAMRMGAYAPHLGLLLIEGAIKSYEIAERGSEKANSQTRGIISLNIPDMQLKPGEKNMLKWRLFSHADNADFRCKMKKKGGIWAECNKYVFEKGETALLQFSAGKDVKQCIVKQNGVEIPVRKTKDAWIAEALMNKPGEVRFDISYGKDKQTHVTCMVIDNIEALIRNRVDFIYKHQQMNDTSDSRDGAFLIFDNEENKFYLNDTPNANPPDRDEGGERVGMGVLLAKYYQLTHAPELKTPLLRYAEFLRKKLQTADYVTYSTTDHKGRNRGYNYMWVAAFYFQMYKVTGEKQYAMDGYQTLQSMFRQFGYGFYAIEIPVRLGLQTLKEAGMHEEYEDLKSDFIKTGDIFVQNGLNYPAHEVNYEQSIVAPAIMFLTQLYLETGVEKYLDEAKRQMPVLEAFGGFQPDYHLNEIAIRHWDGYWFGKREMWGDVFPHYWSTLTGATYYYYALCTNDASYYERAKNIVRNNLCLFFEDGKASCAYIYPFKVDGVQAQFYDPFANDQDWALVYYLLVNN